MIGSSTEGTVTNVFTAPYGTPPLPKPQTQSDTRCLSGLCTPSARPPQKLVKTGSRGTGDASAQSVIPTGGLGVYVQPAGSAVSPSQVGPANSLPTYRPVKGA
jgi:hypothetical protein